MWAVMMTAMMLPSAAPLILLYAGALRTRGDAGAARKTYAIAAGYVLVWSLFSVAMTVLQRALSTMLVLNPMMEAATPAAAAVLLAVAGVYQLTPLKRACLRICRSPLSYLLQHWRADTFGAFRLGARHGAYCLGCCWALMLLLFAGGVMHRQPLPSIPSLQWRQPLTPPWRWPIAARACAPTLAPLSP